LIAPDQFAEGIFVSAREDTGDKIGIGEWHGSGFGWLAVAFVFLFQNRGHDKGHAHK